MKYEWWVPTTVSGWTCFAAAACSKIDYVRARSSIPSLTQTLNMGKRIVKKCILCFRGCGVQPLGRILNPVKWSVWLQLLLAHNTFLLLVHYFSPPYHCMPLHAPFQYISPVSLPIVLKTSVQTARGQCSLRMTVTISNFRGSPYRQTLQ